MKQTEIKLSDILKEKYVNLSLESDDKRKILVELVESAAKSSKLKDKKAFLKAALQREKLGSTGIGNGVAIPHAKLEGIKEFVLVFGRKDGGMDFGALDGEKTFLFFMLASPKHEIGRHLKIMARISRLANDKFVIENLKKAESRKEILKIISANDV